MSVAGRPAGPSTDPTIWEGFRRSLPSWYREAKLGIFVHWGPYSVPAWAEPTGELGTVDDAVWFAHNPYAEWYANTIRIDGSPAARHHEQVHDGVPYDTFLDAWRPATFDAGSWARLFADVGASYVVLTTKHHDGVTLWDAPGTGARNTVHRGPGRDLVGEVAAATRAAGLRFGAYYSGGLDWGVTRLPPHTTHGSVTGLRPRDAAYNTYAYLHVRDLIDRYRPDVLWNDIEWPDAGKRTGTHSLHELFRAYYAAVPDGVVNDRWGDTHHDVRTSEYQLGLGHQQGEAWEHCRGIGLSFGYNRQEGPEHMLSGPELACHLADLVSRGGRLLLNVGPTADGEIPEVQRAPLVTLGRWMGTVGTLLHASSPVPAAVASPTDAPWVRWVQTPEQLVAFVAGSGRHRLRFDTAGVDAGAAVVASGDGSVERTEDGLVVRTEPASDGPAAIAIPRTGS